MTSPRACSALSAALEEVSLAVGLAGSPGLAIEFFRHMLRTAGVLVAGEDTEPSLARVAVLVDPQPEHWTAAKAAAPPIVVVFSEPANDADALDALLAGAEAVLHGNSPPAEVLAVLDAVGQGGTVLDTIQARALVDVARTAASQAPIALSKREGEILASIATGDAVKQTARVLGISPKTVENIQSRLFRKLGVRNRAQAVARAHELGML